jgi:GNAT superfamily N-acetyltransferase
VPGKLTPVVEEKAMKILNNKDYHFKTIDTKNTDKFIEDFMIIYNKAWARFPGIKKLSKAHAAALFKSLKQIMDPRLILYGYYKNEPVAFFIMMPDINQIIREFDGKLNMINKLKLIFKIKYTSATDKVIGRIFGVVPEHQGRGVEAGLIKTFEKIVIKPKFHYKDLEMNWIGDFNPIMMKVCEQIGATILKTHITYRYLFDRSLPFKRAKRVNV